MGKGALAPCPPCFTKPPGITTYRVHEPKSFGDDVSQRANADHDKARDDLVRLVEQSDRFEFVSALAAFKDDIAKHVSEEENYIFPNLRANAAYEIADLGDAHKLEDEVQLELIDENVELIDENLAR